MNTALEAARIALLEAQEQQQRDSKEITRLRGILAEVLATLRAHLECDGNSYANRELYRELISLVKP